LSISIKTNLYNAGYRRTHVPTIMARPRSLYLSNLRPASISDDRPILPLFDDIRPSQVVTVALSKICHDGTYIQAGAEVGLVEPGPLCTPFKTLLQGDPTILDGYKFAGIESAIPAEV